MTLNAKVRNAQNQKGFTLVEIAIVMVIIGLLIGGVLKGQSMIQNAKVKRVVKQADELRAAVMTFYDKYACYPGDENDDRFPPDDGNGGNANGQIAGNEEEYLFEDLKCAGIISGAYDGAGNDSLPTHAFGDIVRILWVDPGQGANHFIRYESLPWDVCLEIDIKYDDGEYDTGSIRANEVYEVASDDIQYFYMPL